MSRSPVDGLPQSGVWHRDMGSVRRHGPQEGAVTKQQYAARQSMVATCRARLEEGCLIDAFEGILRLQAILLQAWMVREEEPTSRKE